MLDNGLILGLLVTGLAVATVPKYVKPFIDALRGREYKIGKKELKLSDDDKLDAE